MKIAIYGKGGIGKSSIATALCVEFARQGRRVLFVGCDPKHDASMKLVDQFPVHTIMGAMATWGERHLRLEQFLMRGRHGIDCLEVGGPEPGVGCAGRGITKAFEVLVRLGFDWPSYDTVVYDVLGDVVCGGFAAPLHAAHAEQVYVVVSGEIMSLYAANNVCHAVRRFATGGVALGGLIGNARNVAHEEAIVRRFATRLQTRLLTLFPRDERMQEAEQLRRTVVEHAPQSDLAREFAALARRIGKARPSAARPPRPMSELQFDQFVKDLHDGLSGR
jgi:nitrogenase iron protein NifH